ncbi:MAG: hypothetical protein AAGF12_19185 [Myxococcota bacterium]
MDRYQLDRWLRSPGRTWRWNHGDPERYEGVTASGEGLRWFRWSHRIDGPGEENVEVQTFKAFVNDGPARPAPTEIVEQLRRWVAEHERG